MLLIGLTGPSGAGKSFAAGIFETKGFKRIDADAVAREVVEPCRPCLLELQRAFGDAILHADGTLDRRRLAAEVFSDPERLRVLNAITHPHILDEIDARLQALRLAGTQRVLLDAPALFQSGADRLCDHVVVVTAKRPLRIARVMERDGLTREEAERRVGAVPDAFFLRRGATVLENDGDAESFAQAARRLAVELRELPARRWADNGPGAEAK